MQRKRNERQNKSSKEKEDICVKDRYRKQNERQNKSHEQKTRTQQKDSARKSSKRAERTSTLQQSINTFQEEIKIGPEFICCCCHRLMYKEYMAILDESKYDTLESSIKNDCITSKLSNDGKQYICNTYHWHMKRNRMPPQAAANNLHLCEIPEELKDLSSLEVALISKRIPFMKILGLPRGKQKAIHGSVINVPCNPDETCGILPRIPSSSSVITVKLKRKLKYRGHVFHQKIRPWKIKRALHFLKFIQRNPHYENIVIRQNWEEDCIKDNEDLWTCLNNDSGTNNDSSIQLNNNNNDADELEDEINDTSDKEDDLENENADFDRQQDLKANLCGLPFDSCLQPKDLSTDPEFILNIAPAEGKKPIGIHSDLQSEVLSFPQLFPDGKFGFDAKRTTKLSLKQYFNARLLNCDNRFSTSTEYLFYAQYRKEAKEIYDSISIAMRKSKTGLQEKIKAADIKEASDLRKLARNDLNYHFLQRIRGSPAYYNKMMYDLLGMIRQLGVCTWFLTLSSADLKWKDCIQVIAAQHGQTITDEQFDNLNWEEKGQWLRTNPVTAARHFDHRLQLFMKTLILGKANPIGHVQDFKYRIEFQQRGSPHAHMVIWIKNAPKLSQETIDQVAAFIDENVSCQYSDDQPELNELIKNSQHHSHTFTCRKHGTTCRFSFQRPPVKSTQVFIPSIDSSPSPAEQVIYQTILASVHVALSEQSPESPKSLDSILESISVTEEQYISALKWIKTKQGHPAILYRRKPSECFINNFNPHLLTAWQANLDIQFITNVYACIMYVASYMSKPEKTLGEVLQSVSKNSELRGPKNKMQNVARKFLSSREVSAEESVYRLLSLPLSKSSRQIIFVPTDVPENRTKLLKPLKVIQELDDDDDDVYQKGMIDKYQMRPKSVENLCLADFASKYSYSKSKKSDSADPDILNNDELEEISTHDEPLHDLPKSLTLLGTNMKLSLKKVPTIIRTHQYSKNKQPEEFYHSKLMLYLPWRHEHQDLTGEDGTYCSKFKDVISNIKDKYEEYEPKAEEFIAAATALEENGPPEDSWASLAPQAEQERREDSEIERLVHPDHLHSEPPSDLNAADLGIMPHSYDIEVNKVSTADWLQMTLSLNEEQYRVHQFITQWCTDYTLTYKTQNRPEPFTLFLTGGAGVGKSHLVKTIVQTANRILSIGQTTDDIVVMVCAYTGAAAFNIDGFTLHSTFQLPVQMSSKYSDYIPIANEQLANMRSKLGKLTILVIDEISMVGVELLHKIHNRLCDIMSSSEPFGGVSVLAVGDLFQLPPVLQKPVFEQLRSDDIARLYGSLWTKHFEVITLDKIMRQRDDSQFALTLNNIRTGDFNEDDIALIQSRSSTKDLPNYPTLALHIFAMNKDVDLHNSTILEDLGNKIVTVHAHDTKRDKETGHVNNLSLKDKAGGLLSTLKICIGARVMLTSNICVQDGLVNSATGTITHFTPTLPDPFDPDNYLPKYIWIQFDENRVGINTRAKFTNAAPDSVSTPIEQQEVSVKCGPVTVTRKQFPMVLAWGITIHKAQGKTVDELVISTKGHFRAGQMYTALSRVKSLDRLFILDGFDQKQIRCDTRSKTEMNRMSKDKKFTLKLPPTLSLPDTVFMKISLLNITSLRFHFACLKKDPWITKSHVIALTETWLSSRDSNDDFEISSDLQFTRKDRSSQSHINHGGVANYIHTMFLLVKEYHYEACFENSALLMEHRSNSRCRLLFITIYNKPSNPFPQFLQSLDQLLCQLPVATFTTILCGDFNINLLNTDQRQKKLQRLLRYHGFFSCHNDITYRMGSSLDHIYINKNITESLIASSTPVHYTDHFTLTVCFPFQLVQ